MKIYENFSTLQKIVNQVNIRGKICDVLLDKQVKITNWDGNRDYFDIAE